MPNFSLPTFKAPSVEMKTYNTDNIMAKVNDFMSSVVSGGKRAWNLGQSVNTFSKDASDRFSNDGHGSPDLYNRDFFIKNVETFAKENNITPQRATTLLLNSDFYKTSAIPDRINWLKNQSDSYFNTKPVAGNGGFVTPGSDHGVSDKPGPVNVDEFAPTPKSSIAIWWDQFRNDNPTIDRALTTMGQNPIATAAGATLIALGMYAAAKKWKEYRERKMKEASPASA